MAGKRYLEINVCKYSVTGESFCSSLKQNLQKVYYELNRVYNSRICHAGLLSFMDDSLIKKKAHSQFDSTCFAQNEKTQLDQ